MKYELSLSDKTTLDDDLFSLLREFLRGENKKFLAWIKDHCKKQGLFESFAGSLIFDDLEAMTWFYERCSHRNHQINQQLDRDEKLIPQKELDDLLVEWVFARKEEK